MLPLYPDIKENLPGMGVQALYNARLYLIRRIYGISPPDGGVRGFGPIKEFYGITEEMGPRDLIPKDLLENLICNGFPPTGGLGRAAALAAGDIRVLKGASRYGKITPESYPALTAAWMLSLCGHPEGPYPLSDITYPVPVRPSMLLRADGGKRMRKVAIRRRIAGNLRGHFVTLYKIYFGKAPSPSLYTELHLRWFVAALVGVHSEISMVSLLHGDRRDIKEAVNYYIAGIHPSGIMAGYSDDTIYGDIEEFFGYFGKLCDVISRFAVKTAEPLRRKSEKRATYFPHMPHLPEVCALAVAAKSFGTPGFTVAPGKEDLLEAVSGILFDIVSDMGYDRKTYELAVRLMHVAKNWSIEVASGISKSIFSRSKYSRFGVEEIMSSILGTAHNGA